jgi:uncharacterized membrane protein
MSNKWLVPAGLLLLSAMPAVGGAVRLADLGGEVTAANARFHAMPLPVVLHILSALPFSMVGAFQFSSAFRRKHRNWHRAAGRVLVVLGLMVAVSGLWMTLVYPWGNNDGEAVYVQRLVFGSAMLLSIVKGIDGIRRRNFTSHGEWMIRGYAIGMGAGTQVFTHLPWFILADGKPGELPRALMMGAGWIINAIVAELIIRSMRGAREQSAARAGLRVRDIRHPKHEIQHAS